MLSLFMKIGAFMFIDYLLILVIGVPCMGIVYVLNKLIRSCSWKRIRGTYEEIKDRDRNLLVVLIHGSGGGIWQWFIVRTYLDYHEIPYLIVKYNSARRINESCEEVYKQLDGINDKDICLIGHSLGGLIAKILACKYMKRKIQPKALVMINTPQQGVIVINWLEPVPRRPLDCLTNELRHGSDFINSMPGLDELEKETQIYEIVGEYDFVRPEHSIMCRKNVYRSYSGHYFSMANPYLWFWYMIPMLKEL